MLQHPYRGWEGELLAAHLLSRICFLARPMSVQTDVGSDFFCTLFEVDDPSATRPLLKARRSFAVQIKTTKDPHEKVEMTRNISYLEQLELPFFIGKVTLSKARLDIYSAEFLPLLLAQEGVPEELNLKPSSGTVDAKHYYEREDKRLLCPFVAGLAIGDGEDPVAVGSALGKVCERALKNIASRLKHQHIYEFDAHQDVIMAGPGSWEHFRENFSRALAEVFANFSRYPAQVPPEEFRLFASLRSELEDFPSYRLSELASPMYERAKEEWEALRPMSGTTDSSS